MVKIPDIPGNYRAGDVVNGHVLSPRGHWISLADAAARGVTPRRYLDTQVSTMRDADTPTQVMRGQPRTARPTAGPTAAPRPAAPRPATYAAGSTTTPRAAAPPPATYAAGSTTTPRVTAPPPAQPRVTAPPPAQPRGTAPPPPLPRVAAAPSASRPVPAPPPASGRPRSSSNQSPVRGKVIGFIVVAFILFQIVMSIARSAGDMFSSAEPDLTGEAWGEPVANEVDVDVTHREVWTADGVSYFLVELAPADPIDAPVAVSIFVEALDGEDLGSGDGSAWVILTDDEPVRVIGEIEEADGENVTDVEVYIEAYAYDGPVRVLEVLDWDLDATEAPPVVAVRVENAGDDEGDEGFVVVVVRDAEGQIVSGAVEWAWAIEAGDEGVVDVTLWDLEELPEGATIEVTAAST